MKSQSLQGQKEFSPNQRDNRPENKQAEQRGEILSSTTSLHLWTRPMSPAIVLAILTTVLNFKF